MTLVEAVPQHISALERANLIRFARADVKRDLRAKRTTVAECLDLECVQTMPLISLLSAQWHWGHVRARKVLVALPCSDALRVGQLTDRQRDRLVMLLGLDARGLETETWKVRRP